MARLILHTGKDEVGKATIVAASKLLSTEIFYRTPYPSIVADHSLTDFFKISPDNNFQPISPKLWKQKTGTSKTLDAYQETVPKMLNKYEEV